MDCSPNDSTRYLLHLHDTEEHSPIDETIHKKDKQIILKGQPTNFVKCKDEAELICTIFDFVRKEDPDILSGYNITGFDIPYLFDRARLNQCPEKVYQFSRITRYICSALPNKFTSGQVQTIQR